MPLTTFFTATGFLAAFLLVWGQLWLNSYKTDTIPDTVYLGLIWTFLGVTVALVAFALAGWSYFTSCRKQIFQVRGLPIGLLAATLIITGANVFQSLVSLAIKLVRESISPTQPLIEFPISIQVWNMAFTVTIELTTGFMLFIALVIVLLSWLGTRNRIFWAIEAIAVPIVILSVLLYFGVKS